MSTNNSNRIVMERTYQADIHDVWELWTTKDGIESWWGPEGFSVTVRKLDLRPGGELAYAMIAQAPEMVAFMKEQGMPTTTEARITYKEVVPHRRLACVHLTDFVPNVAPYDVESVVEFQVTGDIVRMKLTFDRMHDEEWTNRVVMGWESELGKLARVLAANDSKTA